MPTATRSKINQISQKWSTEELNEIFYCFQYALENLLETCTTERTYKLRQERNKTEKLYFDANKLANVRKRKKDTELQEFKNQVKRIIKKMK